MILFVILGGFLVLVCLVVVIVYLAVRGFGRSSGLERLVKRYPMPAPYHGVLIDRQTVMVGEVRYRSCTSVGIHPEGLYLHVNPPLGSYTPMFIPWQAISQTQVSRLYWMPAMRLQLGGLPADSVTVYQSLYEQMRPHLNSHA